jgi:NTE family protein
MGLKTALILSGGGARGAYQVGVLKGVSEILSLNENEFPFKIISGSSAGAINTAHLACQDTNFNTSIEKLVYLWAQLTTDQVFKVNLFPGSSFSLKGLSGLGQMFNGRSFNALLDTSPLKKLIEDNCDFDNLKKNLSKKKFDSVLITANNYMKSRAETFVQSRLELGSSNLFWSETRRSALSTEINADHVMASSAIPLLFPPIKINSDAYSDGCVRNHTPCSPSIRMGAEKLFVIGVRPQLEPEYVVKAEATETGESSQQTVSLIRVLNTLLNAVLLDSVEQDVQRIQRINELVELAHRNNSEPPKASKVSLKKIPALCISPTVNIGEIARSQAHHLPRLLRMTIGALGDLNDANEIISYLMFEKSFCRKLIEIGYNDAFENKDSIVNFFEDDKQ